MFICLSHLYVWIYLTLIMAMKSAMKKASCYLWLFFKCLKFNFQTLLGVMEKLFFGGSQRIAPHRLSYIERAGNGYSRYSSKPRTIEKPSISIIIMDQVNLLNSQRNWKYDPGQIFFTQPNFKNTHYKNWWRG